MPGHKGMPQPRFGSGHIRAVICLTAGGQCKPFAVRSFTAPTAPDGLSGLVSTCSWCSLMIDHAVWRELAAMLYERAENPSQAPSDRGGMLLAEEAAASSGRPVRRWYEALEPRHSAF